LLHKPTGIVMKSQATRSRDQNRKIVRRLLAEKLEVIEKGVNSRKQMKEDAKSKKKRSKDKKARRKYRKLAEEKAGGVGACAVADEAEDDDGEEVDEYDEDDEYDEVDGNGGMVLEDGNHNSGQTPFAMPEPAKKSES
jgi:protein subunit release factor B